MDGGDLTSHGSHAPRRPVRALAWVGGSAFVLALCMTLLWLGMRGIMELGGFVAAGGPYEIAHPAPDWVWIMPVSVLLGMAAGVANAVAAVTARGFNLALPAWAALFLSLGWNFLEYGLRPPGGGLAWGWLVCAVAFFGLGAPAVLLLVRGDRTGFAGGDEARRRRARPWRACLALNLVAVLAGIVAGVTLFALLAG